MRSEWEEFHERVSELDPRVLLNTFILPFLIGVQSLRLCLRVVSIYYMGCSGSLDPFSTGPVFTAKGPRTEGRRTLGRWAVTGPENLWRWVVLTETMALGSSLPVLQMTPGLKMKT